MNIKVQALIDRFVKLLSGWDGVECITLNEAALPATLDPYFAFILDVFCSGEIPDAAQRMKQYGSNATAFETSGNKDRFMIDSLPVRFEFKITSKVEELITIADTKTDLIWLIKDSGTYGFYRLANGQMLYSRNNWLEKVRKRLLNLNNMFWKILRETNQSKMEHFLSDLGAALIQNDDFFYLMSEAGFIKTACLTLFCINKQFEPSHRAYYKKVTGLPLLAESFCAQLETFLRNDPDITPERRYSIAQLIARGIVAL
ncbi:hypothetical protein AGMMS50212_06390 [Spirochaetia bacterium]|nr:hypothetical protein AGMMS50212_06360 [Spirochaetia bacterium]GHV83299.1 hypothetical protein AGMMS50212_06390 [Spirochaetia bacterium]